MTIAVTPSSDAQEDADSRLRRYIGYNMKRAYYEIQMEFSHELKPYDLKVGSFAALAAIVNYPGLKQSSLAQALAIEQANLVQLVDEFEARGLVKRERASGDRRAYALFATSKGRQLYEKADNICARLEADFLAGFSEDETNRFLDMIQQIEQRLKRKRETS